MSNKIKLLLPPFLVWGAIYLTWHVLNGEMKLDITTLTMLPLILLLGTTKEHLYFVPLILQLYLIFYLFKRDNINPLLTVILGLALFFPWMHFVVVKGAVDIVCPIIPFPSLMIYFALGYYLAHNRHIYVSPRPLCLAIAAVGSVLGLFIYLYCSLMLPYWNSYTNHYYSILYAVCSVYLLFCLGNRIKNLPSPIVTISKYSFCIYLAHWLFIDSFNVVPIQPGWVKFLFLSTSSLLCAGFLGATVNMLPIGKYLAGRPSRTEIQAPKASLGQGFYVSHH